MVTLKLTLKGVVASKKNSQFIATNKKTGKQWILEHQRYRDWHDSVRIEIRQWMEAQAKKYKLIYPLAYVKLKIFFYFPDLKERDGVNREQGLFDTFVDLKLLMNDSWLNCDECHWVAKLDRKRPRTEIYIVVKDADRTPWHDHLKEKSRSKRIKVIPPAPSKDLLD